MSKLTINYKRERFAEGMRWCASVLDAHGQQVMGWNFSHGITLSEAKRLMLELVNDYHKGVGPLADAVAFANRTVGGKE